MKASRCAPEAQQLCLICARPVTRGTFWHGGNVAAICADCVRDGKLGILIADAVCDDVGATRHASAQHAMDRALEETRREAWRVAAFHLEQDAAR